MVMAMAAMAMIMALRRMTVASTAASAPALAWSDASLAWPDNLAALLRVQRMLSSASGHQVGIGLLQQGLLLGNQHADIAGGLYGPPRHQRRLEPRSRSSRA